MLGRQQLDKTLAALAAAERSARKRVDPEADAAALADPECRFELLATQYAAACSAEAPLPAQALVYEAMKRKERTPEALAAASAEIEAELIRKQPALELALEELGKARAQSIQAAPERRTGRSWPRIRDYRRCEARGRGGIAGADGTQPEIGNACRSPLRADEALDLAEAVARHLWR